MAGKVSWNRVFYCRHFTFPAMNIPPNDIPKRTRSLLFLMHKSSLEAVKPASSATNTQTHPPLSTGPLMHIDA